jgi:hypothetical protein
MELKQILYTLISARSTIHVHLGRRLYTELRQGFGIQGFGSRVRISSRGTSACLRVSSSTLIARHWFGIGMHNFPISPISPISPTAKKVGHRKSVPAEPPGV